MAEEKQPETMNFDYIKSQNFRVVHADGAFLALTPNGLTLSFYSERQAIPRRVVHSLNTDGSLGEEIREQRLVRDALVRDVEFTVTMHINTAKNVNRVLGQLIARFDELNEQTQKAG